MKFVVSSHGTMGDILPFLPIARELRARGGDVIFLVNDYFRDVIEAEGFATLSTGSVESFLRFHNHPKLWDISSDALELGFEVLIKPTIEATYMHTTEIAENANEICVIGVEPIFNGAFWAAERLYLKAIVTCLWPRCVDSVSSPPAPLKWFIPRWFSSSMKSGYVRAIYKKREAISASKPYFSKVNELRKRFGLEPRDSIMASTIFSQETMKIGLFPPWFGLPDYDWPHNLNLLGFPEIPRRENNNSSFNEFIARHGKPIVFTSGTGVFDTEVIFREGQLACGMLRRPAVFVGGTDKGLLENVNVPFLHLDYLDFGYAFPKCAAVVHHGGIGTLAQALRAQVPQLIRPLSFDQPDNADRAKQLGFGSYLLPKKFKARRVAKELAHLLESPAVKSSIAFYANLMSQQDTTKEACDLIESYVAQDNLDLGLPLQRTIKDRSGRLSAVQSERLVQQRISSGEASGDHEALYSLLSFAGVDVNLQDLHTASPQWLTLANLIEICRDHGVQVRALKVRPEAMIEVTVPCLIQWQHTRFVLFLGFEGSEAKIFDPVLQRQSYTLHEFTWSFSGYVVELIDHSEGEPSPIKKEEQVDVSG